MQLPRIVYHLAEAANWPSIQRDGLLPAAHLCSVTSTTTPTAPY